jgi:hypothetical protein
MGDRADVAILRQGVLAVAVLDDVDVVPGPDGVAVAGPDGARVVVGWERVRRAVGADPVPSATARLRLATLLRTAALLADPVRREPLLRRHARALALPPGHPLHPGRAWVRERVLGGALDVGVGLVDLPWPAAGGHHRPDGDGPDSAPDAPVPLQAGVLPGGELVRAVWSDVREHAVRMGSLAAARIAPAEPGPLRPVGGCDVLTLLATRPLRAALAAGSGLRAVAVPSRRRGWYDLRRVDPAFVAAVWTATEEADRGVSRPMLVTRDEVTLPRPGGDPVGQGLDRA